MKKTIAVIILPLLITGFSFMTSCNSCKNRKVGEERKKIEMGQADTLEKEIQSNVYPLPTSAEVIKMLADLEVGYTFGITNPVSKAKRYITSTDKAINMGVFGADLSYATLYNMNQEVLNYLGAIRTLANELNMSRIYDETLYDKIKLNFDNRDELVKILTEAFDKTYSYLVDNDQQVHALLVVGGAWVEGMYLTTHVSLQSYHYAGISRNLLEQKKSFDLYLEITGPYLSDPVLKEFVDNLQPIKDVYKDLGTSLTQKNIDDISLAIGGVRAKIVK
jgi:hypothetical protein